MLNVIDFNGSLKLSDLAIGAHDISAKSSDNFGDSVCSKHALYPGAGLQTLDGSRHDFGYYMDRHSNKEDYDLSQLSFHPDLATKKVAV